MAPGREEKRKDRRPAFVLYPGGEKTAPLSKPGSLFLPGEVPGECYFPILEKAQKIRVLTLPYPTGKNFSAGFTREREGPLARGGDPP